MSRSGVSESARTVWVAFGANLLVGVAKSIAAVVTGSASMLAEAAHSWTDTGNEVFLLVANRRSYRLPDRTHPLGHGREAYVWSLLAALGLFVPGAAVSVTHGIQALITPEPATDFIVGYVVLGARGRPVTYLRLEIVGPRMVYVIGDVDLVGDDTESHVAVRLRALAARISASAAVADAVLSLSAPDEPSLSP